MKEHYEILEVYGKKNEIEEVKIALHFYKNENHMATIRNEKLMATIPNDSNIDTIIHCTLNAIGSGDLKRIRKNIEEKFPTENSLECYFSKKHSVIERVYVKLALIELNLWSAFKQYFEDDKRTDKEKLFFSEAKFWNKHNEIIKDAFEVIGQDKIDEVYTLALQFSTQENMKDIFA